MRSDEISEPNLVSSTPANLSPSMDGMLTPLELQKLRQWKAEIVVFLKHNYPGLRCRGDGERTRSIDK